MLTDLTGIRTEYLSGWSRARVVYFRLLLTLTLLIAIASFYRDRGQLVSNISLWLFLVPFVVSIWRMQAGLVLALFLLTISPSLHVQLNFVLGTSLHAWAYPGVDCCLGFLAAWVLRAGQHRADEVLDRFPVGPVLLFHAWVALSATIAVCRNIWQSASELSLRGLAYNVWLVRGISWYDDYYPLQDLFFYSVAVAVLIGVWVQLRRAGHRLLEALVGAVLAGSVTNVAFAAWQKMTGKGWVHGYLDVSVHAFWQDIHSFGVVMATCLILGYGFLVTRSRATLVRNVVGLAILSSALGLYLSGSRSTLFLMFALLIGWLFWTGLRLRGWRRIVPVFAAVALVTVIHLMLDHGYRGISYNLLSQRLEVLNWGAINELLSYRPEIWGAALRMYSAFPLFGLGQGVFYRVSAVPNFAGSSELIKLGGDGVHNEFLRILVELGPVGLGLTLFVALPYLRLGRENFKLVSFYALAGIALGNIYTNALLVRELLLLLTIFAGSYIWEAQSAGLAILKPPSAKTMRHASVALTVFLSAAVIEATLSFSRFPFTYGKRCFDVRPLAQDGWTQGTLRVPVPLGTTIAELTIVADRPDLDRRPLDLEVSLESGSGSLLATRRYRIVQHDAAGRRLQLQTPELPDGPGFLEIRPSHCYVPLNLGVTYDPRHLGVRVKDLRFHTALGA